jgi:hypothetical protein
MNRLILFVLACGIASTIHAQTIIPTQTDEIIIDNGSSGKADPNDRIRYKVTIQNTAGPNGTGTQLNIVPDPRTTFVPGSFRSSPLALPDGPYACIGNVGISVPAASGLKLNDFDDNLAGTTLSCGTCMSANGGTVTVSNDGSFTYMPPPGFEGTDTYTYTLNDGNGVGGSVPTNDMATVSITVSGMIWFVDNSQGSNGDGRLGTPFNTLANFIAGAADDAGDNIFFYRQTASNYTSSLLLLNNQRLIGQGATASIAAIASLTVPPFSNALPSTGGTRPFLTSSLGATIILASGNTIRGLDAGGTDPANYAIRDNNATVGTLTISDANISSARNGFRAENGGALNVTFGSITVADGNGGGIVITTGVTGTFNGGTGSITNTIGAAVQISGGTVAVDYDGNLVKNTAAGRLVDIQSHATGAITLDGNLTSSVTGASAIFISSNTSGTISFNGLSKTLNTATNTAIEILNNTGTTINFANGGLDVDATTVTAFSITGGGTVNVTGTSNTINTTSGTAFFTSGTGGSATIDINAAITSATGRVAEINDRAQNNNITLSGNLSNSGTGTGIRVDANSAGTITFSGTSKNLTTGTSTGVTLTSNTGATINFTNGGLVINTSTGTGFNATGGGTVTVQGTGNTINCISATALNVTNTTIGASNLNFQGISSGNNTAAADPVNGIVLNNTGSSGGLSVTGTGATSGSGGTIQFTSNDGISINSSVNISLKNMHIQDIGNMAGGHNTNSGHDGIQVSALTGLILDNVIIRRISDNAILGAVGASTSTIITGLQILNCTIEDSNRFHVANTGDANNEGTIRILGIIGTVLISNTTFQRGAEFLDFSTHTSGTLNMTVTNCDFLNAYKEFTSGVLASVGNHGIDVIVEGSTIANITIGNIMNVSEGNSFLNCRIGSIRLGNNPGATGNMTFIVSNNSFVVNDHSSGIGGDFDFPMGGLLLFSLGTNTANVNAIVSNNYFDEITNASGGVGQFSMSMQGGTWQTVVENNTFDTPGNAPFFVRADTGNSTVLFRNNNYIRGGFCSPDPASAGPGCGGCGDAGAGAGFCGPGIRSLVQAQNGGHINIGFVNEDFAKHDSGFDPGNTVEIQVLNTATTASACANFMNNSSPEGYSVERFGGTLNVQRGISDTSCAGCSAAQVIDVFGDNGNTGGGNNPLLTPPAVTVVGTVNTTNTACPVPSGGIFN